MLKKGSQCSGVQMKGAAELTHIDGLLLPQDHKDDILRICKAQGLKVGCICRHDLTAAGIKREAYLVFKKELLILL